ncbi:MAG TPA: biotin carboxylase N-terminal domain-containing protein [Acidimicrobiales bacterium]|nr:biotin carboxylase N-terminal domain-containing protein [Acidimicrobiales bacterium]
MTVAIRKVLIANRGEIARRVIRTCSAMGIDTTAVYSEVDADAPFVREATDAVPLGGRRPAESYLRTDLLLDAAARTGCDAVHPGYGFLSENAAFAQACAEAGLRFIGPSPRVIELMGSKTDARALMEDAGVPVLPGWHDGAPPPEVVERIGFPMLVKASFGGGGRGMRVVESADELAGALAAAEREAEAAFGNGAVFVERYLPSARHIEVQIFGDSHGNVVHLFERECSIQRRHQKIVEEAPAPNLDDDVRARLYQAAVDAGRALGYEGAGTVEFIVGPDGQFYFLEVNTRLQVEHPVTELITGLDLVRLQLLVADGAPLSVAPVVNGHAVEARLCAEDPADDYAPKPGTVVRFDVPGPVRLDSGVEPGSEVSVDYDAMLAKVIAWAPTREEAVRVLRRSLRDSRINGVITNRDLLVGILGHPEFEAGTVDTAFLTRYPPTALLAAPDRRLPALAAVLARQAQRRAEAPVLRAVPSGWRNNPSVLRSETLDDLVVEYRISGRPEFRVDGERLDVEVVSATPTHVVMVTDGVRRAFDVDHGNGDGEVFVDSLRFAVAPRFVDPADVEAPGSLAAPMPGTVVGVPVAVGDRVEAGDVVVVLEAMKMEHVIRAPEAGVVATLSVAVGDRVDVGTVLAVLEEEEAARVG